jgi:Lrp/AsnC family transcriptional regulator, leucine-responsive regulatory protein
MDEQDRRVLTLLQRDGELTGDELGALVGLSTSAVQRRLKRLKADGVLTVKGVVDAASVGRPLAFVIEIEVGRGRPELLQPLKTWLLDCDDIQDVYHVTGRSDFLCTATSKDMASFDATITALLASNPNVTKLTTKVAFSVLKRSLYVPVDRAAAAFG